MIAKVHSAGVLGIDAYTVHVETNVGSAYSGFDVAGLPPSAVKDSFVRIRAALEHSGFPAPPPQGIALRVEPAHMHGDVTAYDLPIALSLLLAQGLVPADSLSGLLVLGELGFDGSVRRVLGSLPAALLCKRLGLRLALPQGNATEAACIAGLQVHPIATLAELVAALRGERSLPVLSAEPASMEEPAPPLDLRDVRGNEVPKRALEIAAAGGHHLLYIGAPGTGKSMLARRLPGILPPLSESEAIETSVVYSAAGLLRGGPLLRQRPFRAPHHEVSLPGLVGGGTHARPGEISLAHNGVLFLDELPEFRRLTLEGLYRPLEDGHITIVRARCALTYPSRFALVAAMNPCPCGFAGSSVRHCTCDAARIHRYQARLTGPLRGYFDLQVQVPAVDYQTLANPQPQESSAGVRARVVAARARQRKRQRLCNAFLGKDQVADLAGLDGAGAQLLQADVKRHQLSEHDVLSVLRVARTIADLALCDVVDSAHLKEALSMRVLDTTEGRS